MLLRAHADQGDEVDLLVIARDMPSKRRNEALWYCSSAFIRLQSALSTEERIYDIA